MDWKRFEKLTQLPGAPGVEGAVRSFMKKEMIKNSITMKQDGLGGLFGTVPGKEESPRVMVAGHMDEVAFMVTRISKEGFLHFTPLGGWWSQVLLAQRVDVYTATGESVPGVIGSIPPHLLPANKRKDPFPLEEMFIDIGARNEEDVHAFGIRPGDSIIPRGSFEWMEGGHRLMSKACDNRFGCAMSLEVLDEVQNAKYENTVIAGATVQEEVGLRGARTATTMMRPDVFFAVDVGPAGDTPGVTDGYGEIGKGVVIRLMDSGLIMSPGMRQFLIDTAEAEGIPYQFFVSKGRTDAAAAHLQGKGVPSAALGICGRYIHSHTCVYDKGDVEAARAFLMAIIKRLDTDRLKAILGR
ncbi:M42 family metallopeptidase [Mechercharimyces sp. CAU 1602]|uniref:M42 family metallopeptidase n=1 Tax=Mechercharimyces sp. CAU 1602 TaxID=2973933 RepID=UPI00216341DC|nr:M42 family metallopeptidase [Mechercharimyces sp. CAU 1602]MCS1351111.1 M42 family metallopeptidase [Mechercharimyces sp. CAU 1602]